MYGAPATYRCDSVTLILSSLIIIIIIIIIFNLYFTLYIWL